jgi:hypothetical protein
LTNSDGTIAIGSGCLQGWEHIQTDLSDYNVVNHAFGGAKTWEILHYSKRLVINFKPKAVIIYCGSSDIAAGQDSDLIIHRIKTLISHISENL